MACQLHVVSVDPLDVLPLDTGSRAVESFVYAFSLADRGARREPRRVLYPGRNFVRQGTQARYHPVVE